MLPVPNTPPPRAPEPDHQLLWQWLLEGWFGWLHLASGPLVLLLFLLIPGLSRPLTGLLALGLTIAAVGQLALLRRGPTRHRLHLVRRSATALEWLAALGIIALCAATAPAEPVPALLLILLVLTAGRHGLRGLALATVGAEVTIGVMVATEARLSGSLTPTAAWAAATHWGALVGLMALVLALFLGFTAMRLRHAGGAAPAGASQVPPRSAPVATVLTPREAEVLTLLVQGRTRKEIARQLHIAPSTVKTHVEHIAPKLGAENTGRAAIMRAVQLMPPLPPTLPSHSDDPNK